MSKWSAASKTIIKNVVRHMPDAKKYTLCTNSVFTELWEQLA